ncbi:MULTISPECIES: MBL fold metallo-hydrolase [Planococcus]|uniref:MBL fold metallo-hydrolase n=1 Tax=Planococcus faecalis TaxID=1598147 RepID=A0ABM6INZ2_9BACL|nr:MULTISPECIES: MBL fold metallo-hydrolase [Planococcus]AQU78263.1 MBL fold metallo-hydrolase [Planococcus faecalis]MDJ0332831.1 MBL fold metallo-hydrolase [Planococcus sp. S3-L1]
MERSRSTENLLPITSIQSGSGVEIAPDVYCYTVQVANVFFIGNPTTSNEWVLIDAGMPHAANKILEAAEKRFGPEHQLKAIILTHGHFDHVGSLIDILEQYKVPVYAHPLEFSYLKGITDYPKPDTTVEGGLLAKMSGIFPVKAIDISAHLHELPSDGSVPTMPGWQSIHTPGHSAGHVSLFREQDRLLIAGDAFVTVKQDSLYKVLRQKKEIHGPPVYFTTDWRAAWESVCKLADLKPSIAATGHGKPMTGAALAKGLVDLAENFQKTAVPAHGKYVHTK